MQDHFCHYGSLRRASLLSLSSGSTSKERKRTGAPALAATCLGLWILQWGRLKEEEVEDDLHGGSGIGPTVPSGSRNILAELFLLASLFHSS